MNDRCSVDSKKFKCVTIVNPHCLRITFKEQPVTLFSVAQSLLSSFALGNVRGYAEDVQAIIPRQRQGHFYSLEKPCLAGPRVGKLFFRYELRFQSIEYFLIILNEGLNLFVIAIKIGFRLTKDRLS